MTSLYLFLFAFLLPSPASSQCIGKASYNVTFNSVWTAASHPKDYPTGRVHWSRFVGGSHNESYTMWSPGGDATTGVKNVAERGDPTALSNEMTNAGSSTLDIVIWTGIGFGSRTRAGSIDFDDSHTLLSLITMIAPSPDWFVGVRDYDLCNGSKWIQSAEVDLFPYDSGTDSGLKFISTNSATSPPEKIHLLTGTVPNDALSSFFGYDPVPRMAYFTFKLKTLTTPAPPTDKMTTAAKATPTQQVTGTPTKPQVTASPPRCKASTDMSNTGCAYDGKCYKHGDNFNSADGCNNCCCYDRRVSCTEAFCYPLSCPENMEFRNCSYHLSCQQPKRTTGRYCVLGCFCRKGFFEYKGSCVKRRGCSAAKCKPKKTKEVIKTEDGCESERRVNIRRCSGFCADSQTVCQTERTIRKFTRTRCSGGRRRRIAYDTAVKCSCSACDP